jgi:hypothetical protein
VSLLNKEREKNIRQGSLSFSNDEYLLPRPENGSGNGTTNDAGKSHKCFRSREELELRSIYIFFAGG